jgi:hypothetical protein
MNMYYTQTACIDNITVLHHYEKSNDILLKTIVHHIFKNSSSKR